jgi:hypothetical protein
LPFIINVLTTFVFPPLNFVKRGKIIDIVFFTPPLCEAERGTKGEFIGSKGGLEVSSFGKGR